MSTRRRDIIYIDCVPSDHEENDSSDDDDSILYADSGINPIPDGDDHNNAEKADKPSTTAAAAGEHVHNDSSEVASGDCGVWQTAGWRLRAAKLAVPKRFIAVPSANAVAGMGKLSVTLPSATTKPHSMCENQRCSHLNPAPARVTESDKASEKRMNKNKKRTMVQKRKRKSTRQKHSRPDGPVTSPAQKQNVPRALRALAPFNTPGPRISMSSSKTCKRSPKRLRIDLDAAPFQNPVSTPISATAAKTVVHLVGANTVGANPVDIISSKTLTAISPMVQPLMETPAPTPVQNVNPVVFLQRELFRDEKRFPIKTTEKVWWKQVKAMMRKIYDKMESRKFETDYFYSSYDLMHALARKHTHQKVKTTAGNIVECWQGEFKYALAFRSSDGKPPAPPVAAPQPAPAPATPEPLHAVYNICNGYDCVCDNRAELYVPGEGNFCRSCHFNFHQANL